jgi:hypothetical protein
MVTKFSVSQKPAGTRQPSRTTTISEDGGNAVHLNVHGNIRMLNYTKRQSSQAWNSSSKQKISPFEPTTPKPPSATHSITGEHVTKACLVPIPTCVATAKGNMAESNVLNPNLTPCPGQTQQQAQEPSQPLPAKNLSKTHQISTPINANTLSNYLIGYNFSAKSFLVNGFTKGFHIPFTGKRQFRLSNNLASIKGHQPVVQLRIQQELEARRVAGPFLNPPFQNIQVSPLGLVPKKEVGEFRLIHHLSHPEGDSINDHIPSQFCSVQYQTIEDAIAVIRTLGPGTLLAKSDIENAYKQIPIHPDDFELLGFQIENRYYFDKTLPFGLSYSCNLFEKFSSALQWILEQKFSVRHCIHVLDDFLFLGPPRSSSCYSALMSFYQLAHDIGLPIKSSKTVYPTTTLTFLGLELDTKKFEIRLPQDKLTNLQQEIRSFQGKNSVTLKALQSLIGKLNFACKVVPPGRTFLRRLIDLTIGLQKPYHHRRLNQEAKADLKAWQLFLNHFNGKAFFPSGITHSTSSLHLFTDASDLGFGGTFGREWFFHPFTEEWLQYHIAVREFLPKVIALDLWCHRLTNSTVVLHSDNSAVVHVINNNTSKDSHLMTLMRRLMLLSLKNNIHFVAKYFPGKFNTSADLLSRLQVTEFQVRFPHMQPKPTHGIPALVQL